MDVWVGFGLNTKTANEIMAESTKQVVLMSSQCRNSKWVKMGALSPVPKKRERWKNKSLQRDIVRIQIQNAAKRYFRTLPVEWHVQCLQ